MQLPFMVPLPEEGSVFDYFLNLKQYQFVPWSRRGETASRTLRSSGYVALPEVHALYITSFIMHLSCVQYHTVPKSMLYVHAVCVAIHV